MRLPYSLGRVFRRPDNYNPELDKFLLNTFTKITYLLVFWISGEATKEPELGFALLSDFLSFLLYFVVDCHYT